MAAGSRSATAPKPPEPGVIISITDFFLSLAIWGATILMVGGARSLMGMDPRAKHNSC
jgi:hypothetical protein